MIPRDPKRIDRILELLRQAWQVYPDMRLTQLVINMSDINHDCGPVYYCEDTVMEGKLQDFVASHHAQVPDNSHPA